MKTTILALIAACFSLKSSVMNKENTISGERFGIELDSRVKFSEKFDIAGSHIWKLFLNPKVAEAPVRMKSYFRTGKSKYTLRFWMVGERKSGDSLPQIPALYLSLKRVSPIAEEGQLELGVNDLTEDEQEEYKKWYNKILVSFDKIDKIDLLQSNTKGTFVPNSDYYASVSVSAGQDNIGRIVLSVLSMKRLKEKYPNDYKGSIICIDELESTLYPAAQGHLLEFLLKVSNDYQIQFFFSTHSLTLIKLLLSEKYSQFYSLNYAKKTGKNVIISREDSVDNIKKDLYLSLVETDDQKNNRISVYCEDKVTMINTKFLIRNIYNQKRHVNYVNLNGCNISNTQYMTLLEHRFTELEHSIVVLDGDTRASDILLKRAKKFKNIVILPGNEYPEKIIYDRLRMLERTDKLWENSVGGFDYQRCFEGIGNESNDKNEIKKWFMRIIDNQKSSVVNKILKVVFENMQNDASQFKKDFIKAYEFVLAKSL